MSGQIVLKSGSFTNGNSIELGHLPSGVYTVSAYGCGDRYSRTIMLGASTVGKTSIFVRYFNDNFSPNTLKTVGVDFKTKFFKFEETKIKVNYIDSAGQEKFRAISGNYLRGTDGVILVFDLTNRDSLNLVTYWAECIRKNNRENIGMILFGNKSDLEEERQVDYDEGIQLGNNLGCKYYEGSARTGENINFI